MKVIIIKYNAGNIQSVDFALQRLGEKAAITDDKAEIENADKVIFPGVGEAGSTMKYLRASHLAQTISQLQQPVLGICLGMQLMCASSEEGNTEGLSIFPQKVKKFASRPGIKIPHMGWNKIDAVRDGIFKVLDDRFMYFVHSFYVPDSQNTTLKCTYGDTFSAAMQNKNFYGVQFHPEKSGDAGAEFLNQFLQL